MKKILVLITALIMFLTACDAPFWYKVPEDGYVYVYEDPYIEYVRDINGTVNPNSTIELDDETIEFDLCFTGMSVRAWKYYEGYYVLRNSDLLFVGEVRKVKDDGFTIKLTKNMDDCKTLIDDYDYKEFVFKKQFDEGNKK